MRTLAHARSWYEDALPPEPPAPALAGDVRADVAVLGAGLTGLNAALELAARGLRVVLVE
ncbi:MAG TPA: FAD-binding protein, partial [Plasticicumulans sp.]|nr:FAD-binding protein [Plasticicumulans sp.]